MTHMIYMSDPEFQSLIRRRLADRAPAPTLAPTEGPGTQIPGDAVWLRRSDYSLLFAIADLASEIQHHRDLYNTFRDHTSFDMLEHAEIEIASLLADYSALRDTLCNHTPDARPVRPMCQPCE